MNYKLKAKTDEYQRRINSLKEEKIKEVYDEIKKIERKYDVKIDELEYKKYQLSKLKYFNLYDATKIINYLVNKMEDENYILDSQDIIIYGHTLTREEGLSTNKIRIKSKILYLVKEENKDSVSDYFKRKYEFTQEELDTDKKDYIQIAYYKNLDQQSICFDNDSRPMTNVISNISSRIFNYDKLYIIDFMNKLYEYKIDRYDDNITYDDMLTFADGFINSNKDKKILVNKNL